MLVVSMQPTSSSGGTFRDSSFLNRLRSGVANSVVSRSLGGMKSRATDSDDSATFEDFSTKEKKSTREIQFESLLEQENVDLIALKKLSWNGVPNSYRSIVWQLLLGYVPTNRSRRADTIARKRQEYHACLEVYFNVPDAYRSALEIETISQILRDLHRCRPDIPFFQQELIQKIMERILYIWSIRHPASGYVQGMDDLLTPLLYIAVQAYEFDVLRLDIGTVSAGTLLEIEADAYWCLSKLLDNIQDHYTVSQPGVQRMVLRLDDLVHRIDSELHAHFQVEGVQFFQFSFRWMNCLLLREIPFVSVFRLWDTYLSESREGFENFHVYVCAVLLKTFKEQLVRMQFQDLLMFLQELPTSEWKEDDVEPIVAQAFILSTLFDNSPNHLS